MKIKNITAREILDSRGEPTIEVTLALINGKSVTASVPHGKSAGSYEVVHIPVHRAVKNIERIIAKKLRGVDVRKQKQIDALLCELDGSTTKKRLGGNTLLGVSVAVLRAGALVRGMPLWKHIRAEAGRGAKGKEYLHLFVNMINGGVHAGNNLNFQEYLVIPKIRSLKSAIKAAAKFYHELGAYVCALKGKTACNIGDEGGYAPKFKTDLEPLVILETVAKKLGMKSKFDFGIDAAANEVRLEKQKLFSLYRTMMHSKTFSYLEDPFKENDFSSFAKLRAKIKKNMLIVGDDLTTTNAARMEHAAKNKSINAVIIKPNQIGTVTEAFDAVRTARKYKWHIIVSHRSGETNDDFIADFAYGIRAYGLKLGAPARGERIAKYNRLLAIEQGK